MNAIWSPIPRAPGYVASNTGLIAGPRGRLATPATSGGYLTCSIRTNGAKLTTTVQRLVLEAFAGPPPTSRHEANHKNGIKQDNRPENLEWVTPEENKRHAVEVLGKTPGPVPKPEASDSRQPFDLDLRQAGGRNLHIEPRLGYVAWRAVDADSGVVLYCAALKELLHQIADDLPRMLAARNFEGM